MVHRRRFLLLPIAVVALLAPLAALASPATDLDHLCDTFWQKNLEANPVYATQLGDHRWDERLPDISRSGIQAERRNLQWVLDRARRIDDKQLDPARRVTRGALIETVDGMLAFIDCHFESWNVDARSGPQVSFMNLPDRVTISNFRDAQRYVQRVRGIGRYMDQHIANLRDGLAHGRVGTAEAVRRTLSELEDLDRLALDQWPIASPAKESRARWTEAQTVWFESNLNAAVRDVVKPAMERYESFLRAEILAAARPNERSGISALPGGLENYRRLIRVHTSLDLAPEKLHQLGLDEVARVRKELSALGRRALGTGDVATIQKRLRGDRKLHFSTAAEVEDKARQTLERARQAMPKAFGRLPRAHCEVKVMGAIEAPNSTIAYYREPAPDGTRPGYYMINTYKPETRPRYEAEALAFHEAIPGHHLQIAIAQELTGLPAFRKYEGVTAFVEGWGLYAERLANEMGLYSSNLDRIGMLSYDAWRACRLVVDTGIHAQGWSRQRAIDYMMDNTLLAENNIVNEVDRYITTPGQALAYKVGQLEILKLRDEAKRRLGARFDLHHFHDVVLGNGAVALPVLREQVETWIARGGGEASPTVAKQSTQAGSK